MSWEDQGRQEHGWFGHGTAPLNDSAGEGTERSEAEAQDQNADPQAETAAGKAHAWAKISGPVLFGLPRSGPELEAFAEAMSHIEQVRPGSIARALDCQAAQGVFGARAKAVRDGLLTLVQDVPEASGEPTRMPGGSFRDLTPEEQFRVESFGLLRARLRQLEPGDWALDSLSDPDAVPSEEAIARLRAEVEAAEARARLGQAPKPE